MASSIVLSDNGVTSGSAGIKSTGGNDGVLLLQTTTSGGTATTAVTVDNAQNVGVGVTPSASSVKTFEIGAVGLGLTNRAAGKIALLQNAYYNAGFKYAVTGMTTAMYEVDNGGHYWYNAPSGTAGNAITFNQVMTLGIPTYNGSGQLLLNTTTIGNAGTTSLQSGSKLSVGVVAYSSNAFGCIRLQDTSSGTAFFSEWGIQSDGAGQPYTTISYNTGMTFCTAINGGSPKISFDSSGNASKSSGAGSWLALSDSRIKTNVQSVTNGLSRILQLNPVTFDYKSPEAHNGKVHDKGFIADEFMQVYPDSVTETDFVADEDKQYIEEGSKAKAMGFNAEFYADLVSCIQEQQALIQSLTDRLTALEGAAK